MTWYEQLQPASFDGRPFNVEGTEVAGGNLGVKETRVGRGSRTIALAKDVVTYSVEAYFVGADALSAALAFTDRLGRGPGLLIHPQYPAMEALAMRWTVPFRARQIDGVRFTVEFQDAGAPKEAEPPPEPATVAKLTAALEARSVGFYGEPAPLAELQAIGPLIGVAETPAETLAERTTSALLAADATRTTGVPYALQRVGAGLRAAERAQLQASDRTAIADRLLRESLRTDSLTLMSLRLDWLAFTRSSEILAQSYNAEGSTLLSVATSRDLDVNNLAARNRDAVRTWFARGGIAL